MINIDSMLYPPELSDEKVDGWLWSPDCGDIQRKGGKYYYGDGTVSEKMLIHRIGGWFSTEIPKGKEDRSLWTDEKRKQLQDDAQRKRDEYLAALKKRTEEVEEIVNRVREKLTEEEFDAFLEWARD